MLPLRRQIVFQLEHLKLKIATFSPIIILSIKAELCSAIEFQWEKRSKKKRIKKANDTA